MSNEASERKFDLIDVFAVVMVVCSMSVAVVFLFVS